MYGYVSAKLQAGLDIHEDLTTQKYVDEIVRPHVGPHIDNHALADSKDKSGRSCQCNQPRIVSLESRY